jgi:hypothetical protein
MKTYKQIFPIRLSGMQCCGAGKVMKIKLPFFTGFECFGMPWVRKRRNERDEMKMLTYGRRTSWGLWRLKLDGSSSA